MPRSRALRSLAPSLSCPFVSLLAIALTSTGCGLIDALVNPSFESTAAVLKTSSATAHVASASMSAVRGASIDGVRASRTCSAYPCVAGVIVALDGLALPIVHAGRGAALVAGRWRSPDDATLTVRYVGMHAGTPRYPTRTVSIVRVGREGGHIEVLIPAIGVFFDADGSLDHHVVGPDPFGFVDDLIAIANADPSGFGTGGDLGVWSVEIDEAGTPDFLEDDDYWVNSFGLVARGSFDAARSHQLVLHDVLIGPECNRNPIEGDGFVQDLGVRNLRGFIPVLEALGQAVFQFEPKCDGKLRVLFGNGTFMARSLQKVPLQ